MDRLTRKELKTDKFAEEVGHTVEFLEEHRKQATIVGICIAVLIVAGAGLYYYMKHQHSVRQEALREALRVYDATVGPAGNPRLVSYETQEQKNEAIQKAFQGISDEHPGSDEATIATFYLGLSANFQGKTDEAEKYFRTAMESGDEPFDSQAAYSLAQLYAGKGRNDEAEKILRNLVDEPSVLVSKEQATIALARVLAESDPAKARELLEPLRGERSAVSRSALSALGELPRDEQQQ